MFRRHDSVIHTGSGWVYMIFLGPCDGVLLESTGEPAYLYQRFYTSDSKSLWVRSAAEMEDAANLVAVVFQGVQQSLRTVAFGPRRRLFPVSPRLLSVNLHLNASEPGHYPSTHLVKQRDQQVFVPRQGRGCPRRPHRP